MSIAKNRVVLYALGMMLALTMMLSVYTSYNAADAGMSCSNSLHYHSGGQLKHYVYKREAAGPNQVRKYWREQQTWNGVIRYLGSNVC